jgi:autotransporter-associated beta strand protein
MRGLNFVFLKIAGFQSPINSRFSVPADTWGPARWLSFPRPPSQNHGGVVGLTVRRGLGRKGHDMRRAILVMIIMCLGLAAVGNAWGQTLYWDADGNTSDATGGMGNWDTSSSLWRSGSAVGPLQAWTNIGPRDAYLGGTAGTLTLTTAITVNDITVAPTLGTNYAITSNTLTLSGTTPTIDVAGGDALFIGAEIAGTAGVTKTGSGVLELAGSSTYVGGTTVSAGTLNISGSLIGNTGGIAVNGGATLAKLGITGAAHASGTVQVGSAEGNRGMLIVGSGGSLTVDSGLPGVVVGGPGGSRNWANTAGAVYVNGGTFNDNAPTGRDAFELGAAIGGYGYFGQTGGTTTANEVGVASAHEGNGLMEIRGGSFTSANYFLIGRGRSPQTGVLNVFSGGTLNVNGPADGYFAIGWADDPSVIAGIINLQGGNVNTAATNPLDLKYQNSNSSSVGIANLNGGTLSTLAIKSSRSDGTRLVNFNGGTLRALANTTALINNTTNTIYSGGATIDSNGFNVTIPSDLLTPSGNGVTNIAVANGGSGYIAPPIIALSGGGGSGATAIANMVDDETGNGTYRIASITITNPGTGYTSDPTASFVDNTMLYATRAVLGTISTTANALSGGLTKIGSGALTLTGSNTYSGPTTVGQGKLVVSGALGSTAVSVNGGASLGGTGSIAGNVTVAGGSIVAAQGAIDLTDGKAGTLTLSDTNAGETVLTLGGTAGNPSTLDFEVGTTADRVVLAVGKLLVNPGGATISVTPLAGFGPGTYDLFDFSSGQAIGLDNLSLSTTSLSGYILGLQLTPTAEQLVVSVPEPSTFALLGVGAIGVLGYAWRHFPLIELILKNHLTRYLTELLT